MVKGRNALVALVLLLAGCGPESGPQMMREGDLAYERNDSAAALEAYETAALARDLPRDERIRAYFMRGRIYMNAHAYREALGQFNYALKLAPGRSAVLRERGLARAILGDLHGAVTDYDAVLAVNPDDALAHRNRGDALFDLGMTRKAADDYDAALKAYPEDALALAHRALARGSLSGQGPAARADIEAAIALAPGESWPLLLRVQVYSETGAAGEALKTLDQLIAQDPKNVRALHWRAWLNLDAKNYAAAERDLNAAIALSPNNTKLIMTRAELYEREEKRTQAIKVLSEALPALDETDKADALFQRAGLYATVGNFPAAVADYTAVLAVRPDDPLALGNRCWVRLQQNELQSARADCEAAHRLAPDQPFILHSLAAVLEKLGKYVEAAGYYRQAALRDPSNIAFMYDALRTDSYLPESDEAVRVNVDGHTDRSGHSEP